MQKHIVTRLRSVVNCVYEALEEGSEVFVLDLNHPAQKRVELLALHLGCLGCRQEIIVEVAIIIINGKRLTYFLLSWSC